MSLRDEILAAAAGNPVLQAAIDAKDLGAIAGIMSAGRKKVATRMLTERGILGASGLGPVAGDAFLTKLETVATQNGPLRRMLKHIQGSDGVDVGDAAVHASLDALVGVADITQVEVNTIKAMSMVDAPVTSGDVEAALFNADGSAKWL